MRSYRIIFLAIGVACCMVSLRCAETNTTTTITTTTTTVTTPTASTTTEQCQTDVDPSTGNPRPVRYSDLNDYSHRWCEADHMGLCNSIVAEDGKDGNICAVNKKIYSTSG